MTGPQYLRSWLDALNGYEKFVMTLGAGVVNTVLVILGTVSPEIYLALITGTVIAFITGKTVENMRESTNQAAVAMNAANQIGATERKEG